MEVIVGKTAGFCYGVKNAVEKTNQHLEDSKESVTYCLGDLVHNGQVIQKLQGKGLIIVNSLEEIPRLGKKAVIVRAHGIAKQVYEQAKQLDIQLLEYTCPNVLKIHQIIEEYTSKGYYLIYIGEKQHPESIGNVSFSLGEYSVVENEEDIKIAIENLEMSNKKELLIISQTTFSLEKFESYVQQIKEIVKSNIVVKNTICNATQMRQMQTEELARQVECMIIIGGKKSANTKKLYDIAIQNCKVVYIVETKEELKDIKESFEKMKQIGIMAGASTPQSSIQEVVDFLKEEKE